MKKLIELQKELKVPKGQYNTFGGFYYRSCEDIFEAIKPIALKYGLLFVLSDEIVGANDRVYIKATATVIDTESGEKITTSAFAREPIDQKGMNQSQITGSASSYARKYALNGLLALDDTKDVDTNEYQIQGNNAPKNNKENQFITQEEIAEIENLINMTQTDLKALLAHYKLDALNQMNRTIYQDAKKVLKRKVTV